MVVASLIQGQVFVFDNFSRTEEETQLDDHLPNLLILGGEQESMYWRTFHATEAMTQEDMNMKKLKVQVKKI